MTSNEGPIAAPRLIKSPEARGVFLMRNRCAEEGGFTLIHDAGLDEQTSVPFQSQFLYYVGNVAEGLFGYPAFRAGPVNSDLIAIAGDPILRL